MSKFIPRCMVFAIRYNGAPLNIVARENNDGAAITYVYSSYNVTEDADVFREVSFGSNVVPWSQHEQVREQAWKEACVHAEHRAHTLCD